MILQEAEREGRDVRFSTQLHVAVFNAIVNHLGVVTTASASNPITARGSSFGFFGTDALENVFDKRPGLSPEHVSSHG
jgi:hypothetical protein